MQAILMALAAAGLAASQETQPPVASPGSAPLVIWNDLTVGMTKDQVRALYPKSVTPIAEGCFAVVDGDFDKGKLVRVNLEWSYKDQSKQCGATITQTLYAKYGEPADTDEELKFNSCGNSYAKGLAGALANLCKATGGDKPDHISYARWYTGGVEITLKRDSSSEGSWWLVYRPAVKADDLAASKL